MTTVVRTLGFTNSTQRLTWGGTNNTQVTAYLWGGGAGGGGNDSGAGGAGTGGGFTQVIFSVDAGDIIDVAVGGAGGAGASGTAGTGGGKAGASFTTDTVFDTRSTVASPLVFSSTNSAYCSFLNTYGVWGPTVNSYDFDRSYTVNFPVSGYYTFTMSVDNQGSVSLDGDVVLSFNTYRTTTATTVYVSVGNHTLAINAINTGGPGSVGLLVSGGSSYSGGTGGNAGAGGVSGAGGGGGGATVIFKNGTALAVAAGGGGGGGAGNVGDRNGQTAPGTTGQAAVGTNAGQNGQNKSGDGGGGGAGGGGLGGGNGGNTPTGDVGAAAGFYGLSSGPFSNPTGRTPGGTDSEYYLGSAGTGGGTGASGSAGVAALEFVIPGTYVHVDGSFVAAQQTWIKTDTGWQAVQSAYIKNNGVWEAVAGSFAPTFAKIAGSYGTAPRSY